MANEFIELNLIPTGDKPVFHAAQYDVGRPIIIKLKNGEDDFTPTDLDLELQVRKVDNNIVTAIPDSVDGNVVTFLTTQQMTACSGTNLCEVQLSDASTTIATLHFFLVVQRDVLNGGLSSASEIHDLEEQIAEIVPEVIGDDYYDKTEVDALIAEHTFDPTNYYDKQETDQAIQDAISEVPIFDPTNYYDKAATNALLADKANTADLATVATSGDYDDLLNKPTLPDMSNYYTKSETYNKTEIDNALATKQDKIETKTASGSLIHITDGGDNIPMKSCEIDIEPDLNGHTEANLVVCGKNLVVASDLRATATHDSVTFTKTDIGRFNVSGANGNATYGGYLSNNASILLKAGHTYRISGNWSGLTPSSSTVRVDLRFGSTIYLHENTESFTPTQDIVCYLGYRINANYSVPNGTVCSPCVTVDNSDTTYEQYNGTTYNIPFGQTITEGGTLDVIKGELTVGGVTTQITPVQPKTISGVNNIYNDCGSTEIEYFTESADDIAALIRVMTGG